MAELAILPRIKVCGVRDIADVARALARDPVVDRALAREPVVDRALERDPVVERTLARDPVVPRALTPEPVESPIELDAIGFVTWERSPRRIDATAAARVVAVLPRSILPVAVMVDATPADAEAWARASGVRAVQLCGSAESEEWHGFALPIFRRVGVDDGALREIDTWSGIAAAFVLDHPHSHGGSGRTVDLDLAAELSARAPCLLAGGLDAGNVAACVERVRPFGVDASSRLESAPGRKDPERVRTFVRAAGAALSAAARTHERRSEP